MVNQVQDRNSLFSSNIQTFLQRRGQELAGVFLLFGSILWSFILLLFTFLQVKVIIVLYWGTILWTPEIFLASRGTSSRLLLVLHHGAFQHTSIPA